MNSMYKSKIKLSKISINYLGQKTLDSNGSVMMMFEVRGSHYCARYKICGTLLGMLTAIPNTSKVHTRPQVTTNDMDAVYFHMNSYDYNATAKVLKLYETYKQEETTFKSSRSLCPCNDGELCNKRNSN